MGDRDKIINAGTYYKRATDIADIPFNFKYLVPDGETISSHTAHIEDFYGTDKDGTMKNMSDIDGTYVMFRVQAGTVGESYRAIVSATMSGGTKYEAECRVEVVA